MAVVAIGPFLLRVAAEGPFESRDRPPQRITSALSKISERRRLVSGCERCSAAGL